MNSNSFKAKLILSEVFAGTPVPRNFSVVSYPLAVKFDEGDGRDVSSFADIDISNFLTASYDGGQATLWNVTGSGKPGVLTEPGVDYYTSGAVGDDFLDFGSTQYFENGLGDIVLDVTEVVSCSIANIIPNNGFRISFSGSDETDQKTRFAKRFASRHSKNKLLVPKLLVTWDDSIIDSHLNLKFNISSSLFLRNFAEGQPANLVSDDSLTQVQGVDCLTLRLISGSGTEEEQQFVVLASQHTASTTGDGMVGVYSGTFNLTEFNTTFFGLTPKLNKEIELLEIWSTNDLQHGFYTGSVTIKKSETTAGGSSQARLNVTPVNVKKEYLSDSRVTIRFYIEDIDENIKEKSYKLPRRKQTKVFDESYYRILDVETGKEIIPFDKTFNSTRVSIDAEGMYVSFNSSGLPKNRNYTIDLLIVDRGVERLVKLSDISFRVI
jgi:hypothetical protein